MSGPDDQRFDELYREHPRQFVAGRDRLAKELRADDDREGADRVRKLRRPTVAAWLLNRVALDSPAALEEFAAAARALEHAQARALEGEDEGAAAWRAAAGREREATATVLTLAESAGRDEGDPPTARTLELVGQTLRAATADPELRELVLGGRLDRERSSATLGGPAALAPPPARAQRSRERRQRDQARRELQRIEDELETATEREQAQRARADRAAEALRDAKAALAAAKRESAAVRRRLKAAQRSPAD